MVAVFFLTILGGIFFSLDVEGQYVHAMGQELKGLPPSKSNYEIEILIPDEIKNSEVVAKKIEKENLGVTISKKDGKNYIEV